MQRLVSIPKRVSEALKLAKVIKVSELRAVSIPKRVSEALKLEIFLAHPDLRICFNP